MVPKILTFGAGQNGKKFSIWFQFCDIWCTILQMVPFYIWCRNKRVFGGYIIIPIGFRLLPWIFNKKNKTVLGTAVFDWLCKTEL